MRAADAAKNTADLIEGTVKKIKDFGFYGNARKIEGREVPYYQMLLGGGYDEAGVMRFGLAVQSIPARLAPAAVMRVLDHFQANRLRGREFPPVRAAVQGRDLPRDDRRIRQAGRTVPRDLPGLGRRPGLLAATWAAASARRRINEGGFMFKGFFLIFEKHANYF